MYRESFVVLARLSVIECRRRRKGPLWKWQCAKEPPPALEAGRQMGTRS